MSFLGNTASAKYAASLLALLFGVTHTLVMLFQGDGNCILMDGLGWQLGVLGQTVRELGINTFTEFVLSSDIPIVIDDLSAESRFPVPALMLGNGLVSGLCVRLPPQQNAVGILAVFNNKPRTFDHDEIACLNAVAGILSAPVDSQPARAGRQIEAVRTVNRYQLENLVQARTQQLQEANQQFWCEIQELRQLEEELRQSENDIRQISAKMLISHELERKRIASELHNGLSQSLTAIKFSIENAVARGQLQPDGESNALFDTIFNRIQASIEEVHRISTNLYPSMLDDLGIIPTISWVCREFHTLYNNIRLDTHIEIVEDDVPASIKPVIYRILSESLDNIAEHSVTECVSVYLRRQDSTIELLVKYSGNGFVPQQPDNNADIRKSLGIARMREVAVISGGEFSTNSETNADTTVRVVWPAHSNRWIK